MEETIFITPGSCPSIQALRQFARGRIDDESKVIENHLTSCGRCTAVLDEFEAEQDSLVFMLRHSPSDCEFPGDHTKDDDASKDKVDIDGQILEGRYRVTELIARGGMGQVYRAVDLVFGREVAVKVVRPKYRSDDLAAERFTKEAALTARLQHPGIPAMHDLGKSSDGQPFLVMKLVSGRTLAALLQERIDLSQDLQKLLSVFEQIARAVGYAHAQGVIHRDLKPANIMVGAFGEVQVMDWGLAKDLKQNESSRDIGAKQPEFDNSQTLHGTVLGTPAYMPPEQARGEISSLDARADVFALGAILFEILLGRTLYEDTKQSLLESAQRDDKSAALEQLAAHGVDEDLVRITKQCLATDIASRPDNGDVVAELTASYRALMDERLQISERDRAAAEVSSREAAKRQRVALLGMIAFATSLAVGASLSGAFALQAAAEAKKSKQAADEMEKEAGKARLAERKQKEATSRAEKSAELQKQAADLAEQRLKESDRRLSLTKAARVAHQMSVENTPLSRALLGSTPESHRGWEYSWIDRQIEGTPYILYGHNDYIMSVSISPNGWQLASGSRDKTVKLWDIRTGAELRTLDAQSDVVNTVVFSQNGRLLASGAADGKVTLWNAETGMEVSTFTGHKVAVGALAFDNHGTRLASVSSDGILKVWDVESFKELLTIPNVEKEPITIRDDWLGFGRIAFSADGSQLTNSLKGLTQVWNANTGALESSFRDALIPSGPLAFSALSPDQRQLAICSNGVVRVLDARTNEERLSLPVAKGDPVVIVFSPDGTQLATNDGSFVKLWDVQSGRELGSFNGSGSIEFSPDGTWLACSSMSQINIWSARTLPNSLQPFYQDTVVNNVAFNSDGTALAVASDNAAVKLWDVKTGACLKSLRGFDVHSYFEQSPVAFTPNATQFARVSDMDVLQKWEVSTWDGGLKFSKDVLPKIRPDYWRLKSTVSSAAFNNDASRLACGTVFGAIMIWDAHSGERLLAFSPYEGVLDYGDKFPNTVPSLTHERIIRSLLFSPDGTRLVTRSDSLLQLWDVKTGNAVATLSGHPFDICSVSFSPDGTRLISGGSDGAFKIWNAQTGTELQTIFGRNSAILSIAFSPDGSRFATGFQDGRVTIWDTQSLIDVVNLRAHQGEVTTLAFSSDNRKLASGSRDESVKVWDTRHGAEFVNLRGHKGRVVDAYLSVDGQRLMATNELNEVTVWNAATGERETAEGIRPDEFSRTVSPDGMAHVVDYPMRSLDKRLIRTTGLWSEEFLRREYWKPIRHAEVAKRCQDEKKWFAAVWHLSRLLALKPVLTPELKRVTNDGFMDDDEFLASVEERLRHAETEWARELGGN